MKFQLGLIVIAFALMAISFWDAPYPDELKLQHAPTLTILLGLAVSSFYFRMSNLSFVCIISFLIIHIVGARWIYSFVPYDEWSMAILGTSISDHFGWQRNHYDRFVHLASGILLAPPAAESLQRLGGMRPMAAAMTSVAVVLAIGAVYEIVEWQIATILSPAQAESYNGQQGDVWDPQKDMTLAWFGAVLAAVALARHRFTGAI
ncbi:Inner membrane protein YjdF [Rubripirellula tenax]|uniref:Inner membrane protein YjdF n=1 Tax=Rubripirellula tenax TaxID=2528015 RepID=A0A5C6EBL3_9BACT|nr:DUF2238 domain-containing protein [Rubripirellula tenax]TWU47163.1 Inner membrane protein YjdF [Rubripirellula tenax]